jgi:hypothetical protein
MLKLLKDHKILLDGEDADEKLLEDEIFVLDALEDTEVCSLLLFFFSFGTLLPILFILDVIKSISSTYINFGTLPSSESCRIVFLLQEYCSSCRMQRNVDVRFIIRINTFTSFFVFLASWVLGEWVVVRLVYG